MEKWKDSTMNDTRYTVKDARDRWIGTVIIGDDGLVTIYGRGNGTYGHFWPGEMAFGKAGIRAFLVGIDKHYAADKFTMHMFGGDKTIAQDYIRELWPRFVEVLHAAMDAPVTHVATNACATITAAAEWLTNECGVQVDVADVYAALTATAGECTKIGLAAKAFAAARSSAPSK